MTVGEPKLWVKGDLSVLIEFYESFKKCLNFETFNEFLRKFCLN